MEVKAGYMASSSMTYFGKDREYGRGIARQVVSQNLDAVELAAIDAAKQVVSMTCAAKYKR